MSNGWLLQISIVEDSDDPWLSVNWYPDYKRANAALLALAELVELEVRIITS